jgi:Uma2 family endonuclease
MVAQEKLGMTAEAFLEVAALPENADKRLELVNGVIVEIPLSSKVNTVLGGAISFFISLFVRGKKLGVVTASSGGYQIDARNVLFPSVAFITTSRIGGKDGLVFSGAPDLAVEVISPSESERRVSKRVRLYLNAGGRLVWAVYPDEREIEVYHRAENGALLMQTLTEADTLTAGDVLPGFSVSVHEVFAELTDLV